MNRPPVFPEAKWLSNLLLDEHREAYAAMTKDQRACVRFAFAYGWLTKEQDDINKAKGV